MCTTCSECVRRSVRLCKKNTRVMYTTAHALVLKTPVQSACNTHCKKMHIYIYLHTFAYTYICPRIQMRMHDIVHTLKQWYWDPQSMYKYVYTYIYTLYINTYIYIYIHMHIHTYTHTYIHNLTWKRGSVGQSEGLSIPRSSTTQIPMDLNFIDFQTRVLNYCWK